MLLGNCSEKRRIQPSNISKCFGLTAEIAVVKDVAWILPMNKDKTELCASDKTVKNSYSRSDIVT